MKRMNFKILVLLFSSLLISTGCDKEGIPSEYQLVDSDDSNVAAIEVTQPPVPVIPPAPTCRETTEAEYGTIEIIIDENLTQVWLAKNLGASSIAADFNDTEAFGDLFQWGRATDGHEKRGSSTSGILADIIEVQHGQFIISIESKEPDWVESAVDDNGSLRKKGWAKGVELSNTQVCPCGYVVPSLNDFNSLKSATNENVTEALKLTLAGTRYYDSGEISTREDGSYWTRDKSQFGGAYFLYLVNDDGIISSLGSGSRASGNTVRCIRKDTSNNDKPIEPVKPAQPVF